MSATTATSIFVTAQDGLRLHVRSYGPRTATALPLVCLPGLARTGADFETLAARLASDPDRPRRVIALDSRGRGRSDYDRDPANYTLAVELADLIAALTALDIARAVFVGTSRGGLLTMLLAVARPTAIAGCVLNDIGPVIDLEGLIRIKSYVGKLAPPATMREAADILRGLRGHLHPDGDHQQHQCPEPEEPDNDVEVLTGADVAVFFPHQAMARLARHCRAVTSQRRR